MSKEKKILWFIVGNPDIIASSRIQGYRIHNKLVEIGYSSFLAYIPRHIEEEIPLPLDEAEKLFSFLGEGDIVVLQKIKNTVNIPLVSEFKKRKVRIVLIDCDLPVQNEIAIAADCIICASMALCEEYKKSGFVAEYIEDSPELFYENWNKPVKKELNCFWFGHGSGERWKDVTRLKRLIAQDANLNNWKLITISDHPDADIKWHKGFAEELKNADAVAIPVFNFTDSSTVKSANRVLQSMALSVPVICSPLPSYRKIIAAGKNAFLCTTDDEWKESLVMLTDSTVRSEMGHAGYLTAMEFTIEKTIYKWIDIIGLNDSFKTDSSDILKLNKTQAAIDKIFFPGLFRKNFYYWQWKYFTLSNSAFYIRFKFRRIKNMLLPGVAAKK